MVAHTTLLEISCTGSYKIMGLDKQNILRVILLLFCQPRVTVTSCFVYKTIWDLESIDHLSINPIRRIGLIHRRPFDSRWIK